MPVSKTNSGVCVNASSRVEDKDGNLICGMGKLGPWGLYFFGNWDTWRTSYCFSHRRDKLLKSFRLGRVNPITLVYSLFLKVRDAAHKN